MAGRRTRPPKPTSSEAADALHLFSSGRTPGEGKAETPSAKGAAAASASTTHTIEVSQPEVGSPTFQPYVAIRASAGTGKTFALTSRLLRLLLEGVPADRILATTFTRKAAGEILDRVLHRLAVAATSDASARILAKEVQLPGVDADRCRRTLVELVRSLHRVSILTIDAFFMRLAAGFAFEIGLPPTWRIEDSEEAEQLRRAALGELARRGERRDLVALLRRLARGAAKAGVLEVLHHQVEQTYGIFLQCPEERAWCTLGPDDPFEAVGGVGDDQDDLGLNEVPRRCWERPRGADATWIDRLRACELPRTKAGAPSKSWINGLERLIEAASAGRDDRLLGLGLVQSALDPARPFSRMMIPPDLAAVIAEYAAPLRARRLRQFRDRSRAMFRLLRDFHAILDAQRMAEGVYGFEDVARALAQARVTNAGEALYYRIDATIDHLLLDEFQDTSLLQFFLLQPLIEEIISGVGRAVHATTLNPPGRASIRTFFCVGDVKQSLYEWRSAEPELLPAITERWAQVSPDDLLVNWRSSPTILHAVDAVFNSLDANPALQRNEADECAAKRWMERYRPSQARHKTLPGYFALVAAEHHDDVFGAAVDAEDWNDDAAEVEDFPHASGETEAGDRTEEAASRRSPRSTSGETSLEDGDGAQVDDAAPVRISAEEKILCCVETAADRVASLREAAGVRPITIGVLFRRRRFIARMIDALRKRNIRASEEAGNTVDDAPAVAAVLSLIQLADHPDDTAAYFHVCHSPLGAVAGVGPADAGRPSARRRVSSAVRRVLAEDGYAQTIARWIRVVAPACDDRDLRRLEQLLDLAERYEGVAELRPSAFLGFVRANPVDDPSTEVVRVMTIHASKGLEFDYVLLPELEQSLSGRPPALLAHRDGPLAPVAVVCGYPGKVDLMLDPRLEQYQKAWRQRQVEQALCGLYVAMTRARRALECIIAPFELSAGTGRPKPVPASAAGALRGAFVPHLAECRPGDVLFCDGDPQWWADIKVADSSPALSMADAGSVAQATALLDYDPAGPLRIRLAGPRARSTRTLMSRSPSALAEEHDLSPHELLSMHRGRRKTARTRGSVLHAWFEDIEWLRPDDLSTLAGCADAAFPSEERLIETARRLAERAGLPEPGEGVVLPHSDHREVTDTGVIPGGVGTRVGSPGAGSAGPRSAASMLSQGSRRELDGLLNRGETMEDAINLFRRALAREHFGGLLTREHYVQCAAADGMEIVEWEVLREHRFAVLVAGEAGLDEPNLKGGGGRMLLHGAIDRLVLGRDHAGRPIFAEVLDYKTDSGDYTDAAARIVKLRERYGRQMAAYRAAVEQLFGVPRSQVRAKLLVIEPGLVVEMPGVSDR